MSLDVGKCPPAGTAALIENPCDEQLLWNRNGVYEGSWHLNRYNCFSISQVERLRHPLIKTLLSKTPFESGQNRF